MMNSDDPEDENRRALVRIARSLGVPVETFLKAYPVETRDIETAAAGLNQLPGVVMLLRMFLRLKSPEARARCLAYVVQEATHEG